MYSIHTSNHTSTPNRATTRSGRRRSVVAAVLALALLALAACGDDDSADAGPATYVIEAVDFAFDDLPDTIAAGSRLELTNSSPSELHEIVAVRLPDDETRPVSEIVHDDPESLFSSGPPAAVLVTPPGGEQFAPVGDGVLSEPGRYAILCMIPTGVDPAAYLEAGQNSDGPPQFPDAGPPHIAHGMFAEVTVTG